MTRLTTLLAGLLSALLASAASAQNLTGYWRTEGGGFYVVRHVGDEFCWYTEGINVFCGRVVGSYIMGSWLDLPTGRFNGSGRLVLKIESADRFTKVQETARYGGTTWTRTQAPPNTTPTSGTNTSAGTTNAGGTTNPGGTTNTGSGGPAVINGGTKLWDYRAVTEDYGDKIGARIKFTCVPDPAPTTLWRATSGTDIYTGDSVVCQAAVYDGKIGRGGGDVIIEIVPSPPSFTGGTRNGVLSADWGKAWAVAFKFISGSGTNSQMDIAMPPSLPTSDAKNSGTVPPGVVDGGQVGWESTIPPDLRSAGKRIQFTCPPGGRFYGYVWGSDAYTGDSYPCAAAVHAGAITFARGGIITVEIRPGRSSYDGSERNGVRTGTFGQYAVSFVILK